MANSKLKIFLCHSSNDKSLVRNLYDFLKHTGHRVWLDEEDILPGQDWEKEIIRAIRSSDIVLICLSNDSITKDGYVHKEIKTCISIAEEKPDGSFFIIPVRLENCIIPENLKRWQCADLYKKSGRDKLLLSLLNASTNKHKIDDYALVTNTRIQSGLSESITPSLYVPLPIREINQPPRQLTITLRATGNYEADKRRIRTIYGTLISYHGRDRFSFQVFENSKGHLIDFPNDSTRICDELIARLKKLSIADEEIIIESIEYK